MIIQCFSREMWWFHVPPQRTFQSCMEAIVLAWNWYSVGWELKHLTVHSTDTFHTLLPHFCHTHMHICNSTRHYSFLKVSSTKIEKNASPNLISTPVTLWRFIGICSHKDGCFVQFCSFPLYCLPKKYRLLLNSSLILGRSCPFFFFSIFYWGFVFYNSIHGWISDILTILLLLFSVLTHEIYRKNSQIEWQFS